MQFGEKKKIFICGSSSHCRRQLVFGFVPSLKGCGVDIVSNVSLMSETKLYEIHPLDQSKETDIERVQIIPDYF